MPTTQQTDDEKVTKTLTKLLKLINKSKPNVAEILVLYGNLGYHLGASLAGFEGKGPSLVEVKQAYYENPTVDTGLMLQGLLITDWEKDFLKQPRLSNLAKINQKGENT